LSASQELQDLRRSARALATSLAAQLSEDHRAQTSTSPGSSLPDKRKIDAAA
jgi:hypothetical protein